MIPDRAAAPDPLARLAAGLAEAPPGWGAEWSAARRRGTDAELRGWVDLALGWCDEADAVSMRHFRQGLTPERKPDRTFVTAADTAVERLVRERIADAFPDHGVIGEEYGIEAAEAPVRWLVDPIDGTHNYMRGIPVFATLLAVERDGELQAGVISAPALGQRWFAWRGGGAWATIPPGGPARRLSVSQIAELGDAQVVYGSAAELDAAALVPGFRDLLAAAWRERGFGDFWGHALVAEGAAEAMVEGSLSPWDAAAPLVVVEEAGGRVSGIDGLRAVAGPSLLTTNGRLHDAILGRLRGAPLGRAG
jgi:histidinol-phosphatase